MKTIFTNTVVILCFIFLSLLLLALGIISLYGIDMGVHGITEQKVFASLRGHPGSYFYYYGKEAIFSGFLYIFIYTFLSLLFILPVILFWVYFIKDILEKNARKRK